ncbi:MAG: hypothetical protein IT353_01365 [Gemmatimonadaceae bacterium]|nr:hypothetical protein [Gemmatimonadaceae bacterium]
MHLLRCMLQGPTSGGLLAVAFSALVASVQSVPAHAQPRAAAAPRWLAAWGASHNAREVIPNLANSTVRMIVRPSVSGSAIRIKLENTLGQSPVQFDGAFIGITDSGAAIRPRSNRQLRFARQRGVMIAPGESVWSDPVRMKVSALQRLTVSLSVRSASDVSTHSLGLTSTYITAGRRAQSASGVGFTQVPTRATGTNVDAYPLYWISAVDVQTTEATGAVLGFGDSITDGRCSTTENGVVAPDRYLRWTDYLATRFSAQPPTERKAVANAAIAGNRIVTGGNGPTALERLSRDVLAREGVTHVVFFEGTNDLAAGTSADSVIDGTDQIIRAVHDKGIRIIGVTIVPRGRPDSVRGWTPAMESARLSVNHWIRTRASFDAIIDFDALLSGGPVSSNGQSIKPVYNCDHIHPNSAGYKAMGESVDLSLFTTPVVMDSSRPRPSGR